ncbi:MAG: iron-sulfur cluster assembly scaffold protein [Gammaproteobacteria bacterium]|nr:iron-sulfur cluster assembly scaffold protein [Gammaproteobacteria bacterium]MDH3768126.1 iron-sulfur cluster assembly scaffold protein [Gammaproteobacteria bacterium]
MNYSNIVIDHFEKPRNVIEGCDESALSGRAGSKSAGMLVEFCLDVSDGVIEHAGFRAWGCPHTIAVASWLTEEITGKGINEVQSLDLDMIASQLELPAEKWNCVLMAEDALRDATKGTSH